MFVISNGRIWNQEIIVILKMFSKILLKYEQPFT